MAETLGSLCDKLTIVKLKQFHSDDEVRLENLRKQEISLTNEINEFMQNAIKGNIPVDKLTFSANKVFKKEGNEIGDLNVVSIGEIFSELAKINCDLWHEQEKVYEFEKVPVAEKDNVVKQLAILNLKRNQCIDKIDKTLQNLITERNV
jgi:hypothetical protein